MTDQPVAEDAADGFWPAGIIGLFGGELIEGKKDIFVKTSYDLLTLSGGRSSS